MKIKRILIVDDQEDNRYLLDTLLKGHGYEVVTAVHGQEALDKARQNPPDLIITDILMPVMDGFALCRAWKTDEQLKSIPFIFYTATYTDERDRQFALGLGAEQFIVKPEEPEVFLVIIREILAAAERQPIATARPPAKATGEETVYLKQYNEVLIRKLEAKMQQLEEANSKLEQDIALRKIAEEKIRRLNEELERKVAERTAELKDAIRRLEALNHVFVGRELKMAELKTRIADLQRK